MEKSTVSVVVPIYNVERYLSRCLNSIVNQTYKNLDIILVDDESLDRCPIICDEWAKKDSRIKVVHKKNQGLGMARNTGIDNASGEYICFIDSDDYIEVDTIEKVYDCMVKNHADITIFSMKSVNAEGKEVSSCVPNLPKKVYKGKENLNYILPNMIANDPVSGKKLGLNMSACASMYSMKMINECKWRFVSEREYISEDFFSLLVLYKNVNKVAIEPKGIYYYCYNEESLTHTFDKGRYIRINECYKAMIKFVDENKYPMVVKQNLYSQYLGGIIAAMKLIVKSDSKYKDKLKYLIDIVEDVYLQQSIYNIEISRESLQRKVFINLIKKKCAKRIYFLIKIKG